MAQTLDTSFSFPNTSAVGVVDAPMACPDGKVLVYLADVEINGVTTNGLCRFNRDGSLDTSWQGQTNWYPVVAPAGGFFGYHILRDGKVLVWVAATIPRPSPDPPRPGVRIVRLLKDGALDTSFRKIDIFVTAGFANVGDVVVDRDENFIFVGKAWALAYDLGPLEIGFPERNLTRFLRDGTYDVTAKNALLSSGAKSIVHLCTGKYIIVGVAGNVVAAQGMYVNGVQVDTACDARARLNYDFSHDSGYTDYTTDGVDGGGYTVYGAIPIPDYTGNAPGPYADVLMIGTFQTFGGALAADHFGSLQIVTQSGDPYRWYPTGTFKTSMDALLDGFSSFRKANVAVDRFGGVYANASNRLVHLRNRSAVGGAEDTSWDYNLVVNCSVAGLSLDWTGTKLYMSSNNLSTFDGVATKRLIRVDVAPLVGQARGNVFLTMTDEPSDGGGEDPPSASYIGENVKFSSTIAATPISVMRDMVALLGGAVGGFDGAVKLDDTAVFGGSLIYTLQVLIEEGLVVGDTLNAESTAIARIVARLLMSGSATGYADAVVKILDALVLAAVADAMGRGEIAETAVLSDTVSSLYHAFASILEKLLASDTLVGTGTMFVLVSERVAMSSDLTHAAELVAALRDGAGFAASLSVDNGEYIAWVMNTEGDKPVSRYTDFPFNSFAKIGGRYMACDSTGLHWLDGNDDNGAAIRARLRTGMSAMGTRREKRMPEAFLYLRTDGQMRLQIIQVDADTGEKVAGWFKVLARPASNSRETRATTGRGWKAVEFDYVLENIDGADFDLTSIEPRPLNLDRRTRG